MRTCGACRMPLRWDESLVACYCSDGAGGPGAYKACPRCYARATGTDPAPVKVYPPSDRPPAHPYRDDYLPICGMCRECLFEGERNKRIRLVGEDVNEADVEPGAYWACPRCLARWKPVVYARLVRDGVFDGLIESLGGNALS